MCVKKNIRIVHLCTNNYKRPVSCCFQANIICFLCLLKDTSISYRFCFLMLRKFVNVQPKFSLLICIRIQTLLRVERMSWNLYSYPDTFNGGGCLPFPSEAALSEIRHISSVHLKLNMISYKEF